MLRDGQILLSSLARSCAQLTLSFEASDQGAEEVGQEAPQGVVRTERDADADRREEGSREEAGCDSAQEAGLTERFNREHVPESCSFRPWKSQRCRKP
jgi:hypothetical protein